MRRNRVYVIAEIGSCHEGSLDNARKLIAAAKFAGADCAKAQFWSNSKRLAERRNAPELEAMYEQGRLPKEWLSELSEFAHRVGIEFGCTTYLPEDVQLTDNYADVMKIASFEASDPDLLTAHRRPFAGGKRIVISFGMSGNDYAVQDHLLKPFASSVTSLPKYLLCVSAYPAPVRELGLAQMIQKGGRLFDGVSDHTESNPVIAATIVGTGARIIERHLRLDETSPKNPDYPHSSSPKQFHEYVAAVRLAESAMYDHTGGMRPSEASNAKYLVAGRP